MERQFSKSVITVNPNSSVYEALEKMQSNSIKRVVICEEAKPLGIITERDINRFLESDKTARALDEIPVKHLMEKNVVLINNKPKIGAEGYKIVFIHPKSTGGVLVELAEKPK